MSLPEKPSTHICRFAADKLVEVLSQARVFIEPIVSSTGINTKAFTGFEHDLPVLMTTPAASGLHLENFPVPNTVPPDESAFVGAVLQLYASRAHVFDCRTHHCHNLQARECYGVGGSQAHSAKVYHCPKSSRSWPTGCCDLCPPH